MHTTSQTTRSDETYPWDEDARIGDLESALRVARNWADELSADATEPLIARAFGRIYERLGALQAEAVMIDRIARGE